MKFTINWLRQYVDFTFTPQQLADQLTMAGLEVDAVEELYKELETFQVAEILATSPHPNADKLVLCDVRIGEDETRIVCGAPNARAGLFTAVAVPGVVMPGGFKIKKSKIRGEVSLGMLCSAQELGLAEHSAGIIELNEFSPTNGQNVAEALGLRDILIEVDLTPDRPDCASVIGTAREVAAMAGSPLKLPVDQEKLPSLTGSTSFQVKVEDNDLCPRYVARRMTGIKIAPSPWWLQKRLLAVGMRPINNVVDATNFVMLEYGQPLHAFDFSKLAEAKIIVRGADHGEKFTTLDGQERNLDSSMLMICDGQNPVAVAGVMGGQNSEVSEETTQLLLESACFDAVSVRRTSRRLNLSTDASYRFERGVDPQLAPVAMARLVELLTEIAGGTVDSDGVDVLAQPIVPLQLALRVAKVNRLLGTQFFGQQISDFLTTIELEVNASTEETLTVTVPTFRVDITREVDLIEEVARLHGYNEINTTLPVVPMSFAQQDRGRMLRQQSASLLTSLGCYQAINYSFVSPEHADLLGLKADDPLRQTVGLLNPLTEEQSVMRRLLLPGLLENVRRNYNFQASSVRLFEIGKVFAPTKAGEQPHEENHLAIVLSGLRHGTAPELHFAQDGMDFFDIKGVAQSLFADLRLAQVLFVPNKNPAPYLVGEQSLALAVEDEIIGTIGKVDSSCRKQFGIKQEVFFLEINFDRVTTLAPTAKHFIPLPKFPAVQRDIALLVPEVCAAADLVDAIRASGEKLLEKVDLFDVYRGKNIDEGFKSVAISVTYRSKDKTLADKAVAKAHKRIIDILVKTFNGRLRDI